MQCRAVVTTVFLAQIHWPDRYVPLFGAGAYDKANEREDIPFEEQLRGLEAVVKAGKVCSFARLHRLLGILFFSSLAMPREADVCRCRQLTMQTVMQRWEYTL